MKKSFAIALCLVLFILSSCNAPSSKPAGNHSDPYLPVILAYRAFERKFKEGFGERREQFEDDISRDFEMLSQNRFSSLENWLTYGGSKLRYALYEIDEKGTKALVFGAHDWLVDVYTIQNGVAMQQKGVAFWDGYISHLLKNGTLYTYEGEVGRYTYYRFEEGVLKFRARVVSYGGGEAYCIDEEKQITPISEEEYERLKKNMTVAMNRIMPNLIGNCLQPILF
ncbi:MAG: hypothetical protein LBG83_06660 [Oscillospiraceae bacterium]|jgi:hypothetical protein|nr:hypothetical protein [Oscillospiraceae bacterium]